MITKFTEYIVESRKSIEDLEMLNPEELGRLLIIEARKPSPNIEYIKELLDVGCPINHMGQYSRTALHLVSALHLRSSNIPNIIKLFIDAGADIHAKDDYGFSAWDFASHEVKEAVPELNPNT